MLKIILAVLHMLEASIYYRKRSPWCYLPESYE